MKSEKPEITANCLKEQGRKCRLVGKANFFQMSPLRALVLLKLEDWCKMLTVKTCMSVFLSFFSSSYPVEKKRSASLILRFGPNRV